jgi:hypothetical protein
MWDWLKKHNADQHGADYQERPANVRRNGPGIEGDRSRSGGMSI